MKNVCNQCYKVFQADDMTIHYVTGEKGFEIVAVCPQCLDDYLVKTRADSDRKKENIERKRIGSRW